MGNHQVTFRRGFDVLSPSNGTPFYEVSFIEYLGSLLWMRILMVVPLVVVLPMVVPPSSFFCECWHFVWTFCSSHCYIPISEGFMALGPLNRTSPFLCTIWIVPCSSPINPSWFLLILGWWVGVLWGCQLKVLLDHLCPLMAWRRVVLICLLAIRQLSWWLKKESHWYSHGSFIFNDLGVS